MSVRSLPAIKISWPAHFHVGLIVSGVHLDPAPELIKSADAGLGRDFVFHPSLLFGLAVLVPVTHYTVRVSDLKRMDVYDRH